MSLNFSNLLVLLYPPVHSHHTHTHNFLSFHHTVILLFFFLLTHFLQLIIRVSFFFILCLLNIMTC